MAFVLATSSLTIEAQGITGSNPDPSDYRCTASREYITTYRFLTQEDNFKVDTKTARKVALRVSRGCTGAAKRFVQVAKLLADAQMSGHDALTVASDFVTATDAQTAAFLNVLRWAYEKDSLDLSLGAAVKVAREFSLDFKGDPTLAAKDFERLAKFCVGDRDVDLSRPKCAELVAKAAKASERSETAVADAFIDLQKFLHAPEGAAISAQESFTLAIELIAVSPLASENFIETYQFARSKAGLDLAANDALTIAKQVALASAKN